jgi:thiol:disulfide interchange protein
MKKHLILLFLMLAFFSPAAVAQDKNVSIRLLADKTDVKGGDKITIGVEQNIAPQWHVYWINPGDSGIPTTVEWNMPDGFMAEPLQWPIPKKLPYGPLTNYGYEGRAVLLQTLNIPQNIPEGAFDITANIDLLVCKDICLPESHTATLTLNGGIPGQPILIAEAQSSLPLDAGWEAKISESNGTMTFTLLTDNTTPFANVDSVEFFPEEWGIIDNNAATTATVSDRSLTLTHKRGDRALSETPVSKALVVYTDMQGMRKAVRVSALIEGAAPAATSEKMDGITFWQAAIFALLGGLILNLMPCVFPVLSLKALSLVKLKDSEKKQTQMHGIAYTGGILISFGLLAAGLIALKSAGAQIGWGFQLQSPAVIIGLSYLLFIIGLNLAGFFEFSGRLANMGASLAQKEGYAGSFFTGVLATLVATPCTAPFMGVAMGFALTQSAPAAMFVFLAMGLGLALPYLLLTFIPALRHILPRPGAWMDVFKQFLSFPMFATAAWLVWVLSQQTDEGGVFLALLGMIAIAFILWLRRLHAKTPVFKFLSLALMTAAVLFTAFTILMPHKMKDMSAVTAADNFESFTPARLDTLLAEGSPVFVNMTAAWCITCKVNEKVALSIDSTHRLFDEKGVKYLKGDWTNQNPDITKFLAAYGRSGVPLYVYFAPPDEATGKRPDAVILPQILTPAIVAETIK